MSEERFVIRMIDDIMVDVLLENLASYSQNINQPPDGTRISSACRERVVYCQPTGPNPFYHRDDLVDRPRAMGA